MKKILILPFLLFFLIQGSMAQTPKWVEKAKRAVFSVVTYDKNDKMLNTGNGFFVSEDGLALSDYTLFKGAERAVVITSEGKQMPVSLILGANDMYDVIKFRVAITEKKVPALIVAKTAPAVGADAWMLPYSTQKSIACVTGKVKEVSKVAGEYHYYTLGMQMKDKMVSCPAMNAEGQVFGIAQKSSGIDTVTTCYAAGAAFAMSQKISALSLGDAALKKIGIRKGLPETEDQALVYLFMASSSLSGDDYEKLLDDFIRQFPANADGYLRRANYYAANGTRCIFRHLLFIRIFKFQFSRSIFSQKVVVRAPMGIRFIHRNHRIEKNLKVRTKFGFSMSGNGRSQMSTGRRAHDTNVIRVQIPDISTVTHQFHCCFSIRNG